MRQLNTTPGGLRVVLISMGIVGLLAGCCSKVFAQETPEKTTESVDSLEAKRLDLEHNSPICLDRKLPKTRRKSRLRRQNY